MSKEPSTSGMGTKRRIEHILSYAKTRFSTRVAISLIFVKKLHANDKDKKQVGIREKCAAREHISQICPSPTQCDEGAIFRSIGRNLLRTRIMDSLPLSFRSLPSHKLAPTLCFARVRRHSVSMNNRSIVIRRYSPFISVADRSRRQHARPSTHNKTHKVPAKFARSLFFFHSDLSICSATLSYNSRLTEISRVYRVDRKLQGWSDRTSSSSTR